MASSLCSAGKGRSCRGRSYCLGVVEYAAVLGLRVALPCMCQALSYMHVSGGSYALGVLDKRAGVLRLAPAAGAGLVRLEPRVRGYDYGAAPGAAPAAALDREARIEQNKRCARAPPRAHAVTAWCSHLQTSSCLCARNAQQTLGYK